MKPEEKVHQLTVYIPDSRGVTVSRWGRGNAKIGTRAGIYTYSRLPGYPGEPALGTTLDWPTRVPSGTCPGATIECMSICYAARPVAEQGLVAEMWEGNSLTENLPATLPPDAWLVRFHVSGDFTTPVYIRNWIRIVAENPTVRFFGYTRSWRVPALVPWLEQLKSYKNVQLFASMDVSTQELPPEGWRVAWIEGDERLRPLQGVGMIDSMGRNHMAWLDRRHLPDEVGFDVHPSYLCPEQTKHKADCESCRYCIDGKRGDVTFLKH